MTKRLPLLTAALLLCPLPALAQTPTPAMDTARLRDDALANDRLAWDIVEGLTTEIGQRMAGTPAEARAREWMAARFRALGFSNVRIEPFTMPVWVRGEERVEVVGPFPQNLVVTALGNSGSTPAAGVTGDVVAYDTMAAFQAAPAEEVRGKIVFIDHQMEPTQDGSGYGPFGAARRQGPTLASRRGAIAVLVRSIGTDRHRNPHTGVQMFGDGARPIPAGALSVSDALQLQRIVSRARASNQPVRLRIVLTSRMLQNQPSGNVVAEVPGTDPSAGVITIGGHLDSWDLGTGAIDNASGVAITTAAAHRIMQAGRPRRTIRVVAFGAEEVGGGGGRTHFDTNRPAGSTVLVGESDFGADRVWRVQFNLAQSNGALRDRVTRALAPLGIVVGTGSADAGADLGFWPRNGVAAIDLNQDGTRYFDTHHTPDDTIERIDPAQLRQNVAAWTALLAEAANAPEAIEGIPLPVQPVR